MTEEALKLALEALESCDAAHITDGGRQWYDEKLVDKAITAIKEALANEALEKMAENARELGLDYEPAQEPCCYGGIAHDCHAGEGCRIVKRMKATPPQRTWVGLTRIELIKCGVLPFGMSYELYEAIEQALKERNT